MRIKYKRQRKKILAELIVLRGNIKLAQQKRDTTVVMSLGMRLWETQVCLAKLRATR